MVAKSYFASAGNFRRFFVLFGHFNHLCFPRQRIFSLGKQVALWIFFQTPFLGFFYVAFGLFYK